MPSAVLFAGLANPLMLWGMAGASLPIIIHLLNRRKFREMRWAAMQFLLAAIRKNSRRIKIEQWLLLAIRTALVLLVALAMARPFLENAGVLPILAGQRTHRVLVLDGSMSMGYQPAGAATRFEQAKALAVQLLKTSRRGDVVSVVLMGDPPRVVIRDPSPHLPEVLKEINEITLPHGGTDLLASFEAIDRVLESSEIPQKELVVLTDLQAASWGAKGSRTPDALKRVLARVQTRRPRSVVIDLGQPGETNRAVTELSLDAPIVTVGTRANLRATARNFGPDPQNGVRARLLIDGQFGPEKVVDLPPGRDVAIDFPSQGFESPGDHLVEVQIDGDALVIDDHRWLAVPVREFLRILLVDGDFKTEPFQSETDFLAQALNPEVGASGGTGSVIRPEVVAEAQLSRRDLAPYDAIVLCNIAQFTDAEVTALDAYLKQGGGVIVFGGDMVDAENYNRHLFADGTGLLPAALGPAVGNAQAKEAAVTFNPLGFQHPVVSAFAGTPDAVAAGLTGVKTWQYHKLRLPKGTSAKVVMDFSNGDPAVVEARRYRGTVFQVATTADMGWTTWPAHYSFLPVMEQLVLRAASGRQAERNVTVGQPLDQSLPASAAAAPVTVRLPDEKAVATRLKATGEVSQLHFERTDLSGPYVVQVGPPLAQNVSFAVNPLPAESDPAKLSRSGLAEAVPGWAFDYYTNPEELIRHPAAVSQRGELHRPLLIAVLALLLIESVLAWKFGHHAPQG